MFRGSGELALGELPEGQYHREAQRRPGGSTEGPRTSAGDRQRRSRRETGATDSRFSPHFRVQFRAREPGERTGIRRVPDADGSGVCPVLPHDHPRDGDRAKARSEEARRRETSATTRARKAAETLAQNIARKGGPCGSLSLCIEITQYEKRNIVCYCCAGSVQANHSARRSGDPTRRSFASSGPRRGGRAVECSILLRC